MGQRINRLIIGPMVVVVASMGLTLFSPLSLGSLGPKTASAACTWNYYRITWGEVAVRAAPGSPNIITYKYYGNVERGLHGWSHSGWTHLKVDVGGGIYKDGAIPENSRTYMGCS